jgi:hypothetical protein
MNRAEFIFNLSYLEVTTRDGSQIIREFPEGALTLKNTMAVEGPELTLPLSEPERAALEKLLKRVERRMKKEGSLIMPIRYLSDGS